MQTVGNKGKTAHPVCWLGVGAVLFLLILGAGEENGNPFRVPVEVWGKTIRQEYMAKCMEIYLPVFEFAAHPGHGNMRERWIRRQMQRWMPILAYVSMEPPQTGASSLQIGDDMMQGQTKNEGDDKIHFLDMEDL